MLRVWFAAARESTRRAVSFVSPPGFCGKRSPPLRWRLEGRPHFGNTIGEVSFEGKRLDALSGAALRAAPVSVWLAGPPARAAG